MCGAVVAFVQIYRDSMSLIVAELKAVAQPFSPSALERLSNVTQFMFITGKLFLECESTLYLDKFLA